MKRGFLNGLFFGAIVGGIAALLFAPRKGSETREMLNDKISKLKEEIERKKKELEEMEAQATANEEK